MRKEHKSVTIFAMIDACTDPVGADIKAQERY